MGQWRYRILIFFGSLVLVYFVVSLATQFAIRTYLLPRIQELSDSVKNKQDLILADLKLLEANPIFIISTRAKDAQALISGHIPWQSADAGHSGAPENKPLLALKADHPKYGAAEDLQRLVADPRLANVDVAWVDQLEAFDHWNLESAPILHDRLGYAKNLSGIGRLGVLAALPMPDFNLFRFAVFVRFLQMQKLGNPLGGLKLIRHAAYLAHSTNTLVGTMIAVAILGNERTVAEHFGVTDWKPIEGERASALKRVSWAWGGLLHLADWDTFPAEFLPYMKPSNGVCAMVGEKAVNFGIQDFLSPKVPLEPDFSVQLNQINQWNRKLFELCSKSEYLFLLEPPPATAKTDLMAKIPFARRAFGLTLFMAATPSYMRQYEDTSANVTDK